MHLLLFPSAAVSKNLRYTDVIDFFFGFTDGTMLPFSEELNPTSNGSTLGRSAMSIIALVSISVQSDIVVEKV